MNMTERNFDIDQKGRVSLGKLIPIGTTMLKGYYDEEKEEIILKPYIEVPLSTWLLKKPKKLAGLMKGIKEVEEGKITRYKNVQEIFKEFED